MAIRTTRDLLIGALGGEPATFFPVARAYSLIARRRSSFRDRRTRTKVGPLSWFAPFHFTCLMTLLLGTYASNAFHGRGEIPSGCILVATLGFAFIGLVCLFDYFDFLFSAEEYRILGAHPHHPWSIMLAKSMIIGRAIATLAVCFFLPSIVTIAFVTSDAVVTVAWAASSLAGASATGAGAVVLGSAVLASGGRSALLRFLPWVQAGCLILYFSVVAAHQLVFDFSRRAFDASSAWLWFLPSAWFAAPVEWAMGAGNTGTLVRGLLACASFVGISMIGARVVREGFGERVLLGSLPYSENVLAIRRGTARRVPRPTKHAESRAFTRIAMAHMRTDLWFRSQLVMAVIWPVVIFMTGMLSSGGRAFDRRDVSTILFFAVPIAVGLGSVNAAFSTSSSPKAIERVLASPVDRLRFALAPVSLMRRVALGPVFVGIAAWYLLAPNTLGIGLRTLQLAGLALVFEVQLYVIRGVAPYFPFAGSPNRGQRLAWGQLVTLLIGLIVVGLGTLVLAGAWHYGGWLPAGSILFLLVLRTAAGIWAKRRVAGAAASLSA